MNGRIITDECVRLVSMSCKLHDMEPPDIYFIQENKTQFILRDASCQIISYDPRDVGRNVQAFTYVYKEHALYINVAVLKDDLYRRIMCFRVARQIYEMKQVDLFRKQGNAEGLNHFVATWDFAYQTKKTNTDQVPLPLNIDRSAFAQVMMKEIFNIHVNFKADYFEETYRDDYNNVKAEFDYIKLNELMIQYGFLQI